MTYTYTTQKQVRAAFWHEYCDIYQQPMPRKLSNGDYPADARCAFVDYVDSLQRGGQISESLAARVTL